MSLVNERSSFDLEIKFYNAAGALVTPQSAEYYICAPDRTTVQIKDWTAIDDIDETVTITIAPEELECEEGASREKREVVVSAKYADSEEYNEVYPFSVKNLCGLPKST
jgi:Iap family predicted aminopeptidase